MKTIKFIPVIIYLLCIMAIPKNSFGIANKHKKEPILCSPTQNLFILNKPITYDPSYTDNNTIKDAGEFENKYLDKILIRGIIRDTKCVPIPNASIEIWQEDEYGKNRYDKYSYSLTNRYELNKEQYSTFLGIAATTSDNNGRFTFITVMPRGKLKKSLKPSVINISVLHQDFPILENQIILNHHWSIGTSNKKILAFKNIQAQDFYHLPIYDFDITLDGINKYKTF